MSATTFIQRLNQLHRAKGVLWLQSGLIDSQALRPLAQAAQSAADAVMCSSILAGHTNESDEGGDVAVWLGPGNFGRGNERSVLEKFGIPEHEIAKISNIDLSPRGIPSTVSEDSKPEQLDALASELGKLQDLYCFYARPTSGSEVIFSLLGKNAGGWGGLVGTGVWSDD